MARSTLVLDKLPEQQLSALDPRWGDDVLRYGQKIRLLTHPAAQVCRARTAFKALQVTSMVCDCSCAHPNVHRSGHHTPCPHVHTGQSTDELVKLDPDLAECPAVLPNL